MTNSTLTYIRVLMEEDLTIKRTARTAAFDELKQFIDDILPFELEEPIDFKYVVNGQLPAGPDRNKGRELLAIYEAAAEVCKLAESAMYDFEKPQETETETEAQLKALEAERDNLKKKVGKLNDECNDLIVTQDKKRSEWREKERSLENDKGILYRAYRRERARAQALQHKLDDYSGSESDSIEALLEAEMVCE